MAENDGAAAPADAANETAQGATSVSTSAPTSAPARAPASRAPTWRLGPFVVASGFTVSVLVHLALVGTMLFVSPLFGRPAPTFSVPVELVTPDQVPDDKADRPDSKPESKPDSNADSRPDRAAQSGQSKPQPPGEAQAGASLPLPQPALPLDAYALPMPPAAQQAAPPAPTPGPATQLAELIGLPVGGASGGGPSDLKANLTHDEIAAFASHVQSCWTSPASVARDPNLYVVIRIALRRDGGLAGSPEVVAGSASMKALAIKQSAVSALQHCPAYRDLPADKYDEWRLLDLRFTPNGISTATPVNSGQHTPRPG